MVNLNKLAEGIYQGNAARGFWDDCTVAADLQARADPELQKAGALLERALISEKLMLIVSEAAEGLEELRSGKSVVETYYKPEKPDKPEGFPSEIADILIRVFDLAGGLGIDLQEITETKLGYNATRGFKHGGKAF